MTHSNTDSYDVESPTTDLDLADEVVDGDADDPNTAVVIDLPEEPAYKYDIPGVGSVADVNPDYAASGPVATVAFEAELAAALDLWQLVDPEALAGLCDDEDVRTYTYPCERLREVSAE